jgi:hypothetical protein
MGELSEESKKVLQRLRAAAQARKRIPPSQKKPVAHPDKYAFPIGMDDNGNLFPVKPGRKPSGS